jgi:hypothetical protein
MLFIAKALLILATVSAAGLRREPLRGECLKSPVAYLSPFLAAYVSSAANFSGCVPGRTSLRGTYKGRRASGYCQSSTLGRYEFRLLRLSGAFFRTRSPRKSRRSSPGSKVKKSLVRLALHRSAASPSPRAQVLAGLKSGLKSPLLWGPVLGIVIRMLACARMPGRYLIGPAQSGSCSGGG